MIWRKRYCTRKADDSKSKAKRLKLLQRNIWHIKLKSYQIYHNYIREHEGLNGKTPAEACGIKIEGKNKCKTLIQNASNKN